MFSKVLILILLGYSLVYGIRSPEEDEAMPSFPAIPENDPSNTWWNTIIGRNKVKKLLALKEEYDAELEKSNSLIETKRSDWERILKKFEGNPSQESHLEFQAKMDIGRAVSDRNSKLYAIVQEANEILSSQ